jgi:hypothetical protein
VEGIGIPHGLGYAARCFYIDERAFADARAPFRGLQPFALVIHEFGPERKGFALQRFRRVDGAAIRFQKNALGLTWNPEAAQVFSAIDVAALEYGGLDVEEVGETEDIVLGQVDEALLFAAFCAAGLALESQVSQV